MKRFALFAIIALLLITASIALAKDAVPYDLTATSVTANSISLSWDDDGSSKWTVMYAASSKRTATTLTKSITLTGLAPNTTYAIAVRGADGWSQTIHVTTLFQ